MRNREGFTLIELLAVIVILGILAIITVPIVSNYISDSRQKTYNAHETTMEEAAKSLTIECINGSEACELPREGNSTNIYLNELIDKNFSQRLQNPQGDGYCNENLSYVIVTKMADGNYDYKACLYCGNYVTQTCSPVKIDDDKIPPTCGTVEGESSEWTNKPRTIMVGCTDTGGSECTRTKFSKTFKDTSVTGEILISDRAGNTKKCPVNVKIDKNAPTCELEVVGGTEEVNGWVSGSIKVRFKDGSRKDSESGINTWGIGTSMEHPNYDRKELIDLTNINGVVTVFGYVKDNAGNEGTCSKNLRTGVQRPDFDIYYGYQIFPLKEEYTTSNITVTDNIIKTTSTNPTITFSGMSKYVNASRVIITTTNAVTDPTTYTLTVGSTVVRARPMNSNTRLEFEIPKNTYSTYIFKMGDKSNITNTISRIEIQQTKNNLPTNKEVNVNLHPVLSREKVKTTGFSFDDGKNYQSNYYKPFVVTNGEVSGTSQTKNDIPMYSDKKNYKITAGDKAGPTINVTRSPDSWTNQNVTLTGKGQDSASGIIAYGFNKASALPYVSTSWSPITLNKGEITKTYQVSTNGTYYFNLKDEAGNLSNKAIVVDNIDKLKPECNVTGNSTIKCTDSGSSDYAASSIGCYIYGKDATTSSTCKSITATNSLNVAATVNATGTWNLYAKDRAGNISDKKSYAYYSVTYDKNGGTSCTKTSDIVRSGENVDLSPTCSRTGYTFIGWKLDDKAITSHKISNNITLKANWKARQFTVYYYPNGGNGSVKTQVVAIGANWSTEKEIFTKVGSKLDGWSTTANGKVTHSLDKDQGAFNGDKDLNLYAHWSDIEYKITYNANGGTGNDITKKVKYNSKFKTEGKVYSRTNYNLIGWYQKLNTYYYVDCMYRVSYGNDSNMYYNVFYSTKVDKEYSRAEANSFCSSDNKIKEFIASDDYKRYVRWLESRVNDSTIGSCYCSGNIDDQHFDNVGSEEQCRSRCGGDYSAIFNSTCKCSGIPVNGGGQCRKNELNNVPNQSQCTSFCESAANCSIGIFTSSCTCKPRRTCKTSSQLVSNEYECKRTCEDKFCNSTYIKETFDAKKIKVVFDHGSPSTRSAIKEYNLSQEYKFLNTSDIVLYADWQEKAQCPVGTAMVAGQNTDNPTCCTNCTTVSNGSCSVGVNSDNTCKYTTSCNTGYTLVSGAGTNSPVCCPSCPDLGSKGTCTVSWNGSKCVYTTSCKPGYRLSNNGTNKASCTRCPGWRLTNPNDDVFGTIDKIQGQKWEYLNEQDTQEVGWLWVHGDIYTNQVTTDSDGNGVCDGAIDNEGWFYVSKKTKILRKGWVCEDNKWYYLWNGIGTGNDNPDIIRDYPSGELSGRAVINATDFVIDGKKYSFDDKGVCTSGEGCSDSCSSYDSSYLLD